MEMFGARISRARRALHRRLELTAFCRLIAVLGLCASMNLLASEEPGSPKPRAGVAGTPEDVVRSRRSHTGKFLRERL